MKFKVGNAEIAELDKEYIGLAAEVDDDDDDEAFPLPLVTKECFLLLKAYVALPPPRPWLPKPLLGEYPFKGEYETFMTELSDKMVIECCVAMNYCDSKDFMNACAAEIAFRMRGKSHAEISALFTS